MRRPARLLAVAALVLAAVGVPVALPGALSAASASSYSGACTSAAGVTVVVDFESLPGGVVTRCDSSATSSTTGLTALHQAGFTTDGTTHDGPAFVCRIDEEPSTSQDPCFNTPPTTKYWSYWHASNGGSWTYSNEGAATHTVTVGGFEGWSFSTKSGTTVAPRSGTTRPQPAPPAPKPSHSSSSSSSHPSGSHSSGSSSSHSSSSSTSSTTGKATATGSPSTSASAGSTSASSPSSTDGSSATPLASGRADPPAGGSSGQGAGGLVTFLIGLAVVALLAGGGVFYARTRGGTARTVGGG